MFQVGPYTSDNMLALAPMAGVTDRPFRQLCRALGAGWTSSEMVTCQSQLRHSRKTRLRLDYTDEPEPIIIQIAGSAPKEMAQAAQYSVDHGAQIIDLNMGCPAKKVCKVAAGSALLSDEVRVAAILDSVVKAVDVPVTLKTRTGPTPDTRNAVSIARIAEDSGITLLSLHGRSRQDMYKGHAEYDTIAEVKSRIGIPVIANGDIDSPEKARRVLNYTRADGLMIGRAAQGNPWIFNAINHYLKTGHTPPQPGQQEVKKTLLHHLHALHAFYGEWMGPKIARKHIGWYMRGQPDFKRFKQQIFSINDAQEQLSEVTHFFEQRK